MRVIVSRSAGFCYGVRRAVEMAESAGECRTLGPLIHNEQVVEALRKKGVVPAGSIDELPPGATVLIRSHGASKAEYEALEARGCRVLDATCPNVARIHAIVRGASESGRLPVVIGTAAHPEVKAICGWCSGAEVFRNVEELSEWIGKSPENRKKEMTVVCQTTETRKNLENCDKIIKKECTNPKVFDTICGATSMRQREARELAAMCDAMIVVGGAGSANSLRLAEICAEEQASVQFIEAAAQLDTERLKTAGTVGLTAGASTPAWIIKEVLSKMSEEIKDMEVTAGIPENQAEETETSFAELLEQNIKTLTTGDKVVGVVVGISPTEVTVDLGTKHSAYIPVAELSDDPDVKVEDIVKVGDQIETYVMRVNDVEGTAQLSKKRLDTVKTWDIVDEASASRVTLEGIVTEENKGGVVVSVKGVRVFVPASQSGLPREASMSELLKKKVKLRITEVNRSKHRVVGSIRAAQYEERKAAGEKMWETLEPGQKFEGVVRSLTSFGAFVDIGGIDGLVHVTELAWKRVRTPADAVKVGDKLDVVVLAVDKEKKKLSLTCKTPETNPWNQFTAEFEVGNVAKVKILKLMEYGAFAEIIPGVDGLIHISQIADRRIGKPSEVLRTGEEVEAKIIEIDNEKQKVSLSIRAAKEEEISRAPIGGGTEAIVYDTDNKPEVRADIGGAGDNPSAD